MNREDELERTFSFMFQAHPWHGVSAGEEAPHKIRAFIEIVPLDTVKYELDKQSGLLKIDRPQRFSSTCPTLYGFIPQSYCGESVAALCAERTGRTGIKGDGDPMDICVLSERAITHGNLFVSAHPIGGLRMIDHDEADDKILAVLEGDLVYGQYDDISDCPGALIDRLKHYFLSYKQLPGERTALVEIAEVYGKEDALKIVSASLQDYRIKFGEPKNRMLELEKLLER